MARSVPLLGKNGKALPSGRSRPGREVAGEAIGVVGPGWTGRRSRCRSRLRWRIRRRSAAGL